MRFDEAVNNYLTATGNARVQTKDKVIDYFYKNPDANIYQLRQWAEEGNISEDMDIENLVFEIVSEYIQFLKGGLWTESGMPDVNEEELNIGVQLEFKHTSNVESAKRIALNNLTEIPDYYSRLVELKKSAGLEVKVVKKINGKNYLVTL